MKDKNWVITKIYKGDKYILTGIAWLCIATIQEVPIGTRRFKSRNDAIIEKNRLGLPPKGCKVENINKVFS